MFSAYIHSATAKGAHWPPPRGYLATHSVLFATERPTESPVVFAGEGSKFYEGGAPKGRSQSQAFADVGR